MGDLTFFVPPATTATPAAAAAAPEPEPAAAATRPAPRCRRVHFRDLATAATLWLPPSPPDADAMAEEAEPAAPETGGAAGEMAEEDRMDMLWEDFNEELQLAMRRSCSKAGGGPELPSESTSDGEYEPAAGRLVQGCFPVLRPAARAGGPGHYYRRRAGSWVLLMRIFRRLFVIDKTITAR